MVTGPGAIVSEPKRLNCGATSAVYQVTFLEGTTVRLVPEEMADTAPRPDTETLMPTVLGAGEVQNTLATTEVEASTTSAHVSPSPLQAPPHSSGMAEARSVTSVPLGNEAWHFDPLDPQSMPPGTLIRSTPPEDTVSVCRPEAGTA
jgi:hypothetical protein